MRRWSMYLTENKRQTPSICGSDKAWTTMARGLFSALALDRIAKFFPSPRKLPLPAKPRPPQMQTAKMLFRNP
jgi:hypothetical protein